MQHFPIVFNSEDLVASKYPIPFYRFIIDGLSTAFPNVGTILNNFLTLSISKATAERSFNIIKRVNNYLCSTISQEHLTGSAILAVGISA